MQKSYDRIAVPKIVVCSKSVLDDCVDVDECDKRSLLHQRKMIRSRSRRLSRRFSTSIIDRRSPSSSRSPSPSFRRAQAQDEESLEKINDNAGNNKSDVEPGQGKLMEPKAEVRDQESTLDRLQNGFSASEDRKAGKPYPKVIVENAKSSENETEPCRSRHRCDRCIRGRNNKDEACLIKCSGYQQYLRLLVVPQANLEWGEGSGDDLSSEWDSDHTERSNERTIAKVTGTCLVTNC